MPRIVTYINPEDRIARVTERLVELTGGAGIDLALRLEKLSQLRDTSKGSDLGLAAEVAYLLKTRAECQSLKNVAVETVIAGKPDDQYRRVFARITRVVEHDGTTLDLYTKERSVRFSAIPIVNETEAPTRRILKESSHA